MLRRGHKVATELQWVYCENKRNAASAPAKNLSCFAALIEFEEAMEPQPYQPRRYREEIDTCTTGNATVGRQKYTVVVGSTL